MHWHFGPFFVLTLVALIVGARVAMTAIRARHGLGHHRAFAPGALDPTRSVTLLTQENERLVGQVGRLEERIAVLERIVTDPAVRTAREIEALRDR